MPSTYGHLFNDDVHADRYDKQLVRHADHPGLVGYPAALDWASGKAAGLSSVKGVADLGCGTGNLTKRYLSRAGRRATHVTCVDLSPKMLKLAETKLGNAVTTVELDLMDFVRDPGRWLSIDVVTSSYALHHLTSAEKQELLRRVYGYLRSGGAMVVVDPMLPSRSMVAEVAALVGPEILMPLVDKEFPWYLDETIIWLYSTGFTEIELRQFSAVTWGFVAHRARSSEGGVDGNDFSSAAGSLLSLDH